LVAGKDFSVVIVEVLAVQVESVAEEEGASAVSGVRPTLWARASSALQRWSRPTLQIDEEQADTVPSMDEEGDGTSLPSLNLGEGLRSIGQALRRVGQVLVALLLRVLPETESSKRGQDSRSRSWAQQASDVKRRETSQGVTFDRRWLWAAVAIPVIVLLLVVLTHLQYQQSRQAEFKRLITSVEEFKVAAEASPAVAEQRAKLNEMLSLINQALQFKPDDPDLLKERDATQTWLDRINRVSRIFYFGQLQEFASSEAMQTDLRKVAIEGINVFVLDLGTDRVYKFLLNEEGDALKPLEGDQVLLRKGDPRGDFVVDELLDMTWVEAGGFRGTSNLLTLDKKGHVLEYEPMLGLGQLPDADSSMWIEPTAATGYVGRLYLLDPKGNQVLRLVLTNSGYEGTPTSYIQSEAPVDLSKATDLAIDGNVYILHSDGLISKYQEGKGVPFPLNNLDVPLQSPRCLFVTGSMDESGYVYIADSGNQRIVQFSKAGEFIRQFRPSDAAYMSDLRSIFVEEAQKKLYLLNGNKLYMAYLPE
jgi:hypothetical protein